LSHWDPLDVALIVAEFVEGSFEVVEFSIFSVVPVWVVQVVVVLEVGVLSSLGEAGDVVGAQAVHGEGGRSLQKHYHFG
jgi:hypothetical protein